jgi:hypothetical protein
MSGLVEGVLIPTAASLLLVALLKGSDFGYKRVQEKFLSAIAKHRVEAHLNELNKQLKKVGKNDNAIRECKRKFFDSLIEKERLKARKPHLHITESAQALNEYRSGLRDIRADAHVIAVVGPSARGKSTLMSDHLKFVSKPGEVSFTYPPEPLLVLKPYNGRLQCSLFSCSSRDAAGCSISHVSFRLSSNSRMLRFNAHCSLNLQETLKDAP